MKKLTMVLMSAGIFCACSNDSVNLSEKPNGGIKGINGLYSIPAYAGYLMTGTIRYETSGGYTDHFQSRFHFFDGSGNRIYPTAVALGGNAVAESDDQVARTYGITHSWSVTGAGSIPTYTQTVPALAQFRILSPALLDSISKSSGFTLTYGSPGTDSVDILLEYDPLVGHQFDPTISATGTRTYSTVRVANTGSYVVNGTQLSTFPGHGVLRAVVLAHRATTQTIGGQTYYADASTGASVFYYIKN